MKTLLIFLTVIFCHTFTSCDSYISSSNSYEETKLSLEDQEKQNPTEFLTNSGTYRKNLIGQWVLEGTISNNATVATYKDVQLAIEFVSKTGTVINSTEKTLYEILEANSKKAYKLKLDGPDGTAEIRMGVSSAVAL